MIHFSDIDKVQFIKLYPITTHKKLSQIFGVSKPVIQRFAKEFSLVKDMQVILKARSEDTIERKKIIAFDELNKETVYWLGFIFGDGYIHKLDGVLSIGLSRKDQLHLEKILNFMPNPSIYINKKLNSITFKWCSTYLIRRLETFGLHQNKSLDLRLTSIEEVPVNLLSHFIRGIFDADGCINSVKYGFTIQIVSGSSNFLYDIKNLIYNLTGFDHFKVYSLVSGYFILASSGYEETKHFMYWMYKDASVYLERKYNRWLENQVKYIKKTTPIHLGLQPVTIDGISLNSREALPGGAEGNLELSSMCQYRKSVTAIPKGSTLQV